MQSRVGQHAEKERRILDRPYDIHGVTPIDAHQRVQIFVYIVSRRRVPEASQSDSKKAVYLCPLIGKLAARHQVPNNNNAILIKVSANLRGLRPRVEREVLHGRHLTKYPCGV
jgi:hypothetical protein